MNRTYKLFGFFSREDGDGLPDLRQFLTRSEPYPDLERIIGYLESAESVWETSRHSFPDPIDGTFQVGTLCTRTDGEWAWEDDLGYYLRKYPLELPNEFLTRIRALNYTPPEVDDTDSDGLDLAQQLGWNETPFNPPDDFLNFRSRKEPHHP